MPKILWQLALVYLFQWYALFIYWQFRNSNAQKILLDLQKQMKSNLLKF